MSALRDIIRELHAVETQATVGQAGAPFAPRSDRERRACPLNFGGSPRIYAAEERFSAPKKSAFSSFRLQPRAISGSHIAIASAAILNRPPILRPLAPSALPLSLPQP